MYGERLTKTTRPINAPMNLDAGAPDAKQAISLSLFVMGCILTITISGGIALYSVPTGYTQWSIIRFIGVAFGISLAFVAFGFGITMYNISIGLWKDYRNRLADWHDVSIQSIEQANGVETTVSYDRWQLQPDRFNDIWSIIAIVHASYHNENMKLYTRRSLEQPLFASAHGRQVRVGSFGGTDPEKVGNALASLGLIEGRTDRIAGEWKPRSLEEAYTTLVKNWSKVYGNTY